MGRAVVRAIEGRGLVAVHGDPAGPIAALRGLDLTVEEGEMAAVMGPSGSGKTTLLRIIAGLSRPTAGRLDVLGLGLTQATARDLRHYRRTVVAVVEQHYRLTLSPHLPVRQSIALPLALRGVSRRDRWRRADELLDRVGLLDRGSALPVELSGGEQQRVAVAAALTTRPRLLLADEPTGELDVGTAAGLLELIRDLIRSEGATAVIVTHDEAIEQVADRVVHLQDGRAIAERRGPILHRLHDSVGWLAPERSDDRSGPSRAPDPLSDEVVVRLVEVRRTYGTGHAAARALDGITMTVPRGGLHAITGPSGTGKSTLLRLIAGLDDPTGGHVEVLGRRLSELERDERARFRAARLGIVDQARRLPPFLTALENVALALSIRGWPPSEAGERAARTLRDLAMAHLADRRPTTLSAGERTRVAIARAMACDPDVLLLDEPTATLDRANAAAIARFLAGLAHRVTVIAATHDRALMDVATSRFDLQAARESTTPPAELLGARLHVG